MTDTQTHTHTHTDAENLSEYYTLQKFCKVITKLGCQTQIHESDQMYLMVQLYEKEKNTCNGPIMHNKLTKQVCFTICLSTFTAGNSGNFRVIRISDDIQYHQGTLCFKVKVRIIDNESILIHDGLSWFLPENGWAGKSCGFAVKLCILAFLYLRRLQGNDKPRRDQLRNLCC